MFETERLFVRHFTPADLDAFAELCADPQVMRYVGDGTVLTREQVRHWIDVCQRKYAERGYGTSAVFEKATGRFVGYCGVIRAPDRDFDELVYVYHAHTWGRGYATEAGGAMIRYVFAQFDLERMYATIIVDNASSIKVVEKLGFVFEKQVIDDDGVPVNYYLLEQG
jgi:RimJ/RimL family protein N-acetyltransferase